MLTYIFLSGFFSDAYYWFLDVFSGSYTRRILLEIVDLLWKLWPYLVGGILFTSIVKMYISRDSMARFFGNRIASVSIILAAIIGILSPLGSYIIIPMSAALFAIGVPLPPLIALMVASPLIDPNLFLLTMGAMGIEMALMRTAAALFLGITSGYATRMILNRKPEWAVGLLRDKNSFTMERFTSSVQEKTIRAFLFETYKMTKFISKYFFLAILLAAVIKIFLNPNYVVRLFSDNSFLAVLFSTVAGVPLYVCGGAAIPVVQSLAEIGMSKGAALAFFISGPVTKISNLVLLNATFKGRLIVLYLSIGIGGAFILGLIYNLFS